MTTSLIIGSVPAVFVGSLLSSSAPDRYIRPVITFVIAASGLKYVGVGTTALGWMLCAVLLVAGGSWLAVKRPWQQLGAAGEAPPPARIRAAAHRRPRGRADLSAGGRDAAPAGPQRRYLMCIPEIARAITSCWISAVPSKMS